jgi:ferredoxin
MKVRIDPQACSGHGRCHALAPEVFDSDDDGRGVVRFAAEDLPDSLEDAARLGQANCPEKAIVSW